MSTQKFLKIIGTLGIGIFCNKLMIWGFDYILYPYVMWKCGDVKGSIVMTFLSFFVCYGTLKFYDWCKVDWIGIEALKDLRETERKGFVGSVSKWIFRKGEWAVFLFLSMKFDPFIVTAYMRHGKNQYNGLSKRDWRIFLGSLLISNMFWSGLVSLGLRILKWIGVG